MRRFPFPQAGKTSGLRHLRGKRRNHYPSLLAETRERETSSLGRRDAQFPPARLEPSRKRSPIANTSRLLTIPKLAAMLANEGGVCESPSRRILNEESETAGRRVVQGASISIQFSPSSERIICALERRAVLPVLLRVDVITPLATTAER